MLEREKKMKMRTQKDSSLKPCMYAKLKMDSDARAFKILRLLWKQVRKLVPVDGGSLLWYPKEILKHHEFRIQMHARIKQFKTEVRKELPFFFYNNDRGPLIIDALMEPEFLGGLLECVLKTEPLHGDIIELGTYRGGSTIMIARFLKRIDSKKTIFACDTFEGCPYDDKFSTIKDRQGFLSDTNVLFVEDKFRRFGVADKIVVVKGSFEDTLPKVLGQKRFSFAFVDCNVYESTKFVLEFLAERMTDNGLIALHDYGSDLYGLTRAVDEWCRKNGFELNMCPIPHILTNRTPSQSN